MTEIGSFAYPTCIRRPDRASRSEYCHDVWYGKKLEWCGYPMVKKFEDIFIRFNRVPNMTDRHTDTA